MKISMKKRKTMHVFSKSATQKSDVRYTKKEKKTPLSQKKLRLALTVLKQSDDVYNKQEKFGKKRWIDSKFTLCESV